MRTDLIAVLERIKNKKMLVIGDMVADVYLEGSISRISREAPVIILKQVSERVIPGGAANLIHNAATLGGKVFAAGVIGSDNAGDLLRTALADKGVNTEGLFAASDRNTITKTRIMAGGQATVRQQVVRIDREPDEPLASATAEKLIHYAEKMIPEMDAVILSDYEGGTITPEIRAAVIHVCRQHGVLSAVDSRYRVLDYVGIDIVKQNETEAAAALGLSSFTNEKELEAAGKALLEKIRAQAVLISRGPDGMSLFEADGSIHHIPVTNKSEVYDVTGAGDTVVAAMMLAAAAGAPLKNAAELSNYAAGVVVRKPGTATTDPAELRKALGD